MAEKETEEELRTIVVPELPSQQVNKAETETGETINLITVAQALTEMYADIKKLVKAVA